MLYVFLDQTNKLKIQFLGLKNHKLCFFGHYSGQKLDNIDGALSNSFKIKTNWANAKTKTKT